jgi:hypothetical protein
MEQTDYRLWKLAGVGAAPDKATSRTSAGELIAQPQAWSIA